MAVLYVIRCESN